MLNRTFAIDIRQDFPPARNFADIGSLFNLIVPNLIIIAGVIFFILLIGAGITIMVSGDNPEALKKGQQFLTYSIAGIAIILVSYILLRLIDVVFNLNLNFLR